MSFGGPEALMATQWCGTTGNATASQVRGHKPVQILDVRKGLPGVPLYIRHTHTYMSATTFHFTAAAQLEAETDSCMINLPNWTVSCQS